MKTLAAVIVLIGWLPATAGAAARVELAPRFRTDDETHYISRSVVNHKVQVDEAGVAESVVVRTEAAMTLTVTDVDSKGSAELVWQLRYVALSTDGAVPGIEEALDYDSRDPARTGSPLAPVFSRLIERPVTIRVDASGRVLDFQGVDTVGLAGPLGALAQGFFSRQAFEQLPLFVTSEAPSPARARTKWSKSTRVGMPLGVGSLVMDQNFAVKRIDARRKTAAIEMKGVIAKGTGTGPGAGGVGPVNPAQALTVDDGTVAGEYHWDFAAGRLESAETQLELATTLDTPLGRMKLRQDMTSSVRRTNPKDAGLPDKSRGKPRGPKEEDRPGI